MIEKITDFGSLSGVSSPLLPLVFADGCFSQNDLDGAFLQRTENGEIQAVFSLKNTCVALVLLNCNATEELEKFFCFCGVSEILSDTSVMQFSKTQKELNLLEFCKAYGEDNDCLSLNRQSTIGEYQGVYKLVFEEGNNFEKWFPEFSKKVNSFNSFATYLKVNDNIISAAISPAVYKNTAVIAGVFTLKEYRNQGYAGKCVKALLKELRENNICHIYLWCEDNNLKFYENLGFKNIGKIYCGECN